MKPRKLIPSILLILILLFTFVTLSFSQVRQQYLRDFSYLTADLKSMQEKVDDFIAALKRGDLRAFKYVTYDVLERSVLQIKDQAVRNREAILVDIDNLIDPRRASTNQTADVRAANLIAQSSERTVPFMFYLLAPNFGGATRENLIRCTLQGLFNLDPRVRLTAVHFLRKLRPDKSMQRTVKMAVGIDSEWISYDRAKRDFVFRPPQRRETVASRWEYYREKDLNWPTDVNPGQWGLNDHIDDNLNEGDLDTGVTTELISNRWGEVNPRIATNDLNRYNLGYGRAEVQTRGYERMSDADKEDYMKRIRSGQVQVRDEHGSLQWEDQTFGRYVRGLRDDGSPYWTFKEDNIPLLDEQYYRRYSLGDDEGNPNRDDDGAELLSYQSAQVGDYVPMGQGPRYTYVNCNGYRMIANPFAETMKLDEFITRVVWYNKIKARQMNCLAIISKDTFSTLWRSIDGEIPNKVPFLSTGTTTTMLDHTDVPVLLVGLHRNKNLLIQWVIMRSLKDIYTYRDTPANVKEDINIALWEARREINRRSYVHGLVLTKESIRVGKLDAAQEHRREVAALQIEEDDSVDRAEREDLGFATPNTEIMANGYRLIWGGPTQESDQTETKLSLDELRKNRVYAYKNENNDIIDYYRDKDRFFALQKQYAGNPLHEVVNVNLLERAQALVNALLTGNEAAWRTATWPEVETAVILTMSRVQCQFEAHSADPNFVTTFMDQLRQQEPTVTIKINNNEEKIVSTDEQEANGEIDTTSKYDAKTYSDAKRDNIVRAALGGLFNRDPRIRLECIHFLRRLGPDDNMLDEVIRARSVMATDSNIQDSPETDDYRSAFIDTNVYERKPDSMIPVPQYRYEGIDEATPGDTSATYGPIYIPTTQYTITAYEYQTGMWSNIEHDAAGNRVFIDDIYGKYQLKAPSEELDKLYKFCLRDKLVKSIRDGEVDAITRMTRAEFGVLAEVIDNEFILDVPFASFYSDPFPSSAGRTIKIYEIRGNRVIEDEIMSTDTGLAGRYAIFSESDIKVIKKGIDSTNFLVQKGTAEFLIRFYNSYPALTADVKREIQDALYFYKQDDIVVEEIVLAFEGQNPDGRAVIKVGTRLAEEMNPGGIRVYNSLPIGIRKDIRDAILDEQEEFPEALINILGVIGRRAPSVSERDRLDYQSTATGEREVVGRPPTYPEGFTDNNIQN